MTSKAIEVTGIGYPNKGAELMLCAVAQKLRERFGEHALIATSPTLGSDMGYRALTRYGLHQRGCLVWKGFDLGTPLGNRLPEKLLRSYGFVAEKQVNIILDASGLRYTDKWGYRTVKSAVHQYERVKQRGGKVILLPQAFGPFENPKVQHWTRKLYALSDLIFARDPVSSEHLQDLVRTDAKIMLGPDFTAAVHPVEIPDRAQFAGKVCIIPNQRMLDKTDTATAKAYYRFLTNVIQFCLERGEGVFLLNHEGPADEKICQKLMTHFDGKLGYTGQRDAVAVKSIIGYSGRVLTSRFHGLVSSLSQGVPSLSTSWSHKYEQLSEFFGVPKIIVHPEQTFNEILPKMESWASANSNECGDFRTGDQTIITLHESIGTMWQKVWQTIG